MNNLRINLTLGILTILTIVGCSKPPTCETSGQYIRGFTNGVESNFKGNLLIQDKRELVIKILNIQTIKEGGGVLECNVKFSWNLKRDNQEYHVKDSDMVLVISKGPGGELTAAPESIMNPTRENTEKNLEFITFLSEMMTVNF
jgi:hypothetical protein